MNAPGWQESRVKRLQVALIVAVSYPLFVLLRWTLRWRVEGREHLDRLAADGHPPIVGFWHGRILAGMYYFRNQGIVVLTSQNFDGEWIARIITRFGYGTARGSSSRNATSALREMIRHVRAGRGAAFTLDGPRGPARRAKSGAIWLASATGSPIVPFHVEADRAWTMKSWDGSQIPKPFSRVCLVVAEPVPVPRGLDADATESYCRVLESRLEEAAARARAMAGRGAP